MEPIGKLIQQVLESPTWQQISNIRDFLGATLTGIESTNPRLYERYYKPVGEPVTTSYQTTYRKVPNEPETIRQFLGKEVKSPLGVLNRLSQAYQESPSMQDVFSQTRNLKAKQKAWIDFFLNKKREWPTEEFAKEWPSGASKDYGAMKEEWDKFHYLESHPEVRRELELKQPEKLPYWPNLIWEEENRLPLKSRIKLFKAQGLRTTEIEDRLTEILGTNILPYDLTDEIYRGGPTSQKREDNSVARVLAAETPTTTNVRENPMLRILAATQQGIENVLPEPILNHLKWLAEKYSQPLSTDVSTPEKLQAFATSQPLPLLLTAPQVSPIAASGLRASEGLKAIRAEAIRYPAYQKAQLLANQIKNGVIKPEQVMSVLDDPAASVTDRLAAQMANRMASGQELLAIDDLAGLFRDTGLRQMVTDFIKNFRPDLSGYLHALTQTVHP